MTLDQIRHVLHEDSPVVIHLVSGREFRVPHTDYAALGIGDRTLTITDEKGSIELILLESIESMTLTKEPAA